MIGASPIYLHFLDRELCEAVSASLTYREVERLSKILLLGTSSLLYCGQAALWENPALQGEYEEGALGFVAELTQQGALDIVSRHPTLEEFLETQRMSYGHDRPRYPSYFEPKRRGKAIGPSATRLKNASGTRSSVRELSGWESTEVGPESELERIARRAVRAALKKRRKEAVTFSLFRSELERVGGGSARVAGFLRRRLSEHYTAHMAESGTAEVATGIRPLEFFDRISGSFPLYDVALIGSILNLVGLRPFLDMPFRENRALWLDVLNDRASGNNVASIGLDIRVLLRALHSRCLSLIRIAHPPPSQTVLRNLMLKFIASHAGESADNLTLPTADTLVRARVLMTALVSRIEKQADLEVEVQGARRVEKRRIARIVVVTATDVERNATLRAFGDKIAGPRTAAFGSRRSYARLGELGGVEVFLVQTEIGSVSPGGSLGTVSDAIDDLKPAFVLMVGIAFGVDPLEQEIGEILVSRQLQCYELSRVGTSGGGERLVISRGDKITASSTLLGRLRLAAIGWEGARVRYELMLSGEKLIDNVDYRAEILELAPEAKGGEMEGAGLYAAAAERRVDWIVVKAICDWADGKKRVEKLERQKIAADQAASFVARAVEQGGFAETSGGLTIGQTGI